MKFWKKKMLEKFYAWKKMKWNNMLAARLNTIGQRSHWQWYNQYICKVLRMNVRFQKAVDWYPWLYLDLFLWNVTPSISQNTSNRQKPIQCREPLQLKWQTRTETFNAVHELSCHMSIASKLHCKAILNTINYFVMAKYQG